LRSFAAVGFVNSCATFLILVGAPLAGFTFALPGHGRAGFLAIAGLAVRPSQLQAATSRLLSTEAGSR
jgi:hypothetical protein